MTLRPNSVPWGPRRISHRLQVEGIQVLPVEQRHDDAVDEDPHGRVVGRDAGGGADSPDVEERAVRDGSVRLKLRIGGKQADVADRFHPGDLELIAGERGDGDGYVLRCLGGGFLGSGDQHLLEHCARGSLRCGGWNRHRQQKAEQQVLRCSYRSAARFATHIGSPLTVSDDRVRP